MVAFELQVAPPTWPTRSSPRSPNTSTTTPPPSAAHSGAAGAHLPDLLRQRTEASPRTTGLRRWVAEPGVDEWHGTFPSEDAATAWAAIDTSAHDLVANGTCTTIEQARGKALTDLVTGNATIGVQVVLTVPAAATTPRR